MQPHKAFTDLEALRKVIICGLWYCSTYQMCSNVCVPCSRDWEDVSRLLSDIGLILEYADILAGQPGQPSGCGLLETQLCLQHVASLACMHLPFICGKGWPALASRVSTPC